MEPDRPFADRVHPRGRRFDGENTWFYFLWYGLGRAWVEGLRTDSLYLFDWTLFGEPIRVSQALSVVMVIVSAAMLFYNIRLRPHDPGELLVNQVAAAQAAAEVSAETAVEQTEDGNAAVPVPDGTAEGEEPKEESHGEDH